eukprot:scaffold27145_cov118-Isochrysis_galbana.AAC.3
MSPDFACSCSLVYARSALEPFHRGAVMPHALNVRPACAHAALEPASSIAVPCSCSCDAHICR